MFKILLSKLNLLEEYIIEYDGFFRKLATQKNDTISFYYYKNCPKFILEEAVFKWIKNRVLLCFGNVIGIYSIGKYKYSDEDGNPKQFVI